MCTIFKKNEWHNERHNAPPVEWNVEIRLVFTRIRSPRAKSTSTLIRSHFQRRKCKRVFCEIACKTLCDWSNGRHLIHRLLVAVVAAAAAGAVYARTPIVISTRRMQHIRTKKEARVKIPGTNWKSGAMHFKAYPEPYNHAHSLHVYVWQSGY